MTVTKVSNINEKDNVLRVARKKYIAWEIKPDGRKIPVHFHHDVFKRREDENWIKKHGEPESGLSVNWIEFFKQSSEEKNIEKAIKDFRSAFKFTKNDAFSKLNIGELKKICAKHKIQIRIAHDSELKKSPVKGHSSISQFPLYSEVTNKLVFTDLCEYAFKFYISAKNFC